MGHPSFEITVHGVAPDRLVETLGARPPTVLPDQTVLVTTRTDQDGLYDLMCRLRDVNLEVTEVRTDARAAGRHHPTEAASGRAGGPRRATYELRIDGLLGPVLLSSLPAVSVARVPQGALAIRLRTDDDVCGVLRTLVESGLEVLSLRRVET